MQRIVLAILLAFCGVVAQADNVIVHARRVNITSAQDHALVLARRVNISSAQQDAEIMARSGVLRHCGTAGGRREGIGMSSASPLAAERACCFYSDAMRGRYRIVEKGVAWSPVRRAWFAVIRYE